MTVIASPRLDRLPAGTLVTLRFQSTWNSGETYDEKAIFLGVVGKGDDRRARFLQRDGDHRYEWEAYRSCGRWAYGSGAQRVSVIDASDLLAAAS